jgi:hypothetical protein
MSIKNTYENKKKIINKKVSLDNQEGVEALPQPTSKKKKKNNSKKETKVLDNSENVKNMKEFEVEMGLEKAEGDNLLTPKKESLRKNSNEEMVSPRLDEEEGKEIKNGRNDPAQKKNKDSEKKIKGEKVRQNEKFIFFLLRNFWINFPFFIKEILGEYFFPFYFPA